jgi:acetyl-CoA acetyltransferase
MNSRRSGVTGAILIGTMLDELEWRDLKGGLMTMCAAGRRQLTARLNWQICSFPID